MTSGPAEPTGAAAWTAADVHDLDDLARVLRELRRRHARRQGGTQLSYRDLAAATGWSHGIIGEYLSGRILPPTDRFDVLIRLLGATPAEQGPLATARDRVEERRRGALPTGGRVTELPVPRQLPADVFAFTGRAEQLAALDDLLAEDDGATSVVISAVSGTAGVGKTALAVRWAHRVADRFGDGQLYVDLRGYDPDRPVSPADALAGFLRGLGVDGADLPADIAERSACYRSLLAGRRMLVVLDNAFAADQVRPLLPGDASCFVVVTSRDDLVGLVARDGARRIDLDVLSESEALVLLRTLVGARVDEDPDAAAALAERCVRLPLALRVAAELATADPDRPLAELVADLHDEQRRLDLLGATGDPRAAVRAVFSWSYRYLAPTAARAFGLLGLHPGRQIDAYAVAALADTTVEDGHALVSELARAHLVEPAGSGLHAMHDLLRAYAVECGQETHDAQSRRAALSRLLDHFRHTASAAMDTLFPYERHNRPDVPPARSPAPPVDEPARALAWLDRQRPNLVAVAAHAARHGWPQHSIDLSRILWRHLEVGGHHHEALAVHGSAVEAVGTDQNLIGGESVLGNLGSVHWWLGDHREARVYFEQSLAGHRAIGDDAGEARALARLGLVQERLGDYRESLASLEEALAICRRIENRHGEGSQLINVGTLYRRLGRYAEAAAHEREAAAIFVELGDRRLEGYALGNLGAVECLRGRHAEALVHLEEALAHCRESSDRGGEGSALGTLGAVFWRTGRFPEALDHLHSALVISRETGDRSLETETLNTLGETLRAMRQYEAALARHRAALTLTRRTGDRFEHARALDGTADALHGAGQVTRAQQYWRRALTIYVKLGVPEADHVRVRLAG